jgi:hypothetical protein
MKQWQCHSKRKRGTRRWKKGKWWEFWSEQEKETIRVRMNKKGGGVENEEERELERARWTEI